MECKTLLVISITLMLFVTLAVSPVIADSAEEDKNKDEVKLGNEEITNIATLGMEKGDEKIVKPPQIAWIRKGPISVSAYGCNDWKVYYGGSLSGKPVTVVSLSIPWHSNSHGHSYSINTENNYMGNSYAWVQVKSLDSTGVPGGSYINLIGIY